VGQLCARIKTSLEDEFSSILVAGEISNLREYDSGHVYFTIKEAKASISAVLFAGIRRALPAGIRLKDGMKAVFAGRVSFYSDRGQCQIIVSRVTPEEGEGDLFRRFEELKRKLADEGLFAEALKKPLPWYPRRVAVITSTGGSVLHDIIETSAGRAPGIDIIVYPSAVQGDGAAAELIRAVQQADRDGLCDVIIIARGGGSIEDLWPFNNEGLARAIVACQTPVVSGVGHEPDVTICDFVADLRAPTPSTAALRVFPERAALSDAILSYQRRIKDTNARRLRRAREQLSSHSAEALMRIVRSRIEYHTQQNDTLAEHIRNRMLLAISQARGRLGALAAGLGKHDPGLPFKKGYALIHDAKGPITKAQRLALGNAITISFADGKIGAVVTKEADSKSPSANTGES
jgi:exodeoxyribonuclease VII large subunit